MYAWLLTRAHSEDGELMVEQSELMVQRCQESDLFEDWVKENSVGYLEFAKKHLDVLKR